MPGLGILLTLLYFISEAVLSVLSHPHFSCRLIQRTALCENWSISSIPSDLPQKIEELILIENSVLRLHNNCLSRYPYLRLFTCANNHLRTVEEKAFSGSTLIESLNLSGNDLHSDHKQVGQALSTLTKLRTLDLSSNGLTEDMVSEMLQNLSSLEYLNLSSNILLRLDEVTFRNLHQLKELNLEKNQLFEIDGAFDHLTKLQRLNLAFNYLPCLVKFEMTQLVVLNASHNLIEWFISNQDLNDTFQLEALDLSDNRLLYFPFLPIHSHIKTLLLSNNRIGFYSHLANNATLNWTTSVEYYNVGKDSSNVTVELWKEDLHGDISSVELLDLSGNQMRYFPHGFLQKMPNLYWLKLRQNCLEFLNLTTEELPAMLYELDVSNNRLCKLHTQPSSVSKLNNLTYLNLSLNDIQTLPPRVFTTLPSLSTVDISYNQVGLCHLGEPNTDSAACAVWANIPSLKQLHIAGCNIRKLPPLVFEGTPLTHLELSNNPDLYIGRDCLASLSKTLQHLGLSNTGLQSFNFSPYKHLKSLNISKNSISEFPPSLMTLNLNLLDLRDNKLTTINNEHATELATRVQTVYVNGNAFNCCQLEWFRTFEKCHGLQVIDLSEVTCVDLQQRRHKAVLFDSILCGNSSTEESIFWYILLFASVILSLVGILVIYFLTFRPRMLPRAIKKRFWKPTPY